MPCRLLIAALASTRELAGLGVPGSARSEGPVGRSRLGVPPPCQRRRGPLLVSREVVVNLIGTVTTACELDENGYATDRKATDEQLESLSIQRDEFPGEWNYTFALRLENDQVILARVQVRQTAGPQHRVAEPPRRRRQGARQILGKGEPAIPQGCAG